MFGPTAKSGALWSQSGAQDRGLDIGVLMEMFKNKRNESQQLTKSFEERWNRMKHVENPVAARDGGFFEETDLAENSIDGDMAWNCDPEPAEVSGCRGLKQVPSYNHNEYATKWLSGRWGTEGSSAVEPLLNQLHIHNPPSFVLCDSFERKIDFIVDFVKLLGDPGSVSVVCLRQNLTRTDDALTTAGIPISRKSSLEETEGHLKLLSCLEGPRPASEYIFKMDFYSDVDDYRLTVDPDSKWHAIALFDPTEDDKRLSSIIRGFPNRDTVPRFMTSRAKNRSESTKESRKFQSPSRNEQ